MSRYKMINVIDKIFITSAIFLIMFAWINFFIRNLWLSFVLSVLFSLAIVFILFHLTNKKQQKSISNQQHIRDMNEKFLAFLLLTKNNQLRLLKSIIEKDGECLKFKDSLITTKDNKTTQIMLCLENEKVSQFNLINFVRNTEKNVHVLKILCNNFENNLNTKILKNLTIEFVTKKELYENYFLPHNLFPDCSNLSTENERKNLKTIAKNFINPNKTKSYFLCGLVLIFSSIILPFKTYYLIFGSILLIFSILCKLQPIFKH